MSRVYLSSKTLPTDPCFAYPKPPTNQQFNGSEFLNHLGVWGCLGYAKQGYVGFPLDKLFKTFCFCGSVLCSIDAVVRVLDP